MDFVDVEPNLGNYRLAIIFFDRSTASYKFAFKLFYVFDHSAENLNQETESRWNLFEKSWELDLKET